MADPQTPPAVAELEARLRKYISGLRPDPLLERLTAFVATALKVPVVFMTLVDEERQHFINPYCLTGPLKDVLGTHISHSFCRHVVRTGEPLIVPDTREHPVTAGNPVIVEKCVLAYAGVPMVHSTGVKVGTLCAIEYTPRAWSAEDMIILRAVAAQVMTELELRLTMSELTETLMGMRTAEQERRAATRHAVHDLRTPISSLLLCLETLPLLGSLNEEQHAYVNICARATGTLRTIVDSLMDADSIAQHGRAALHYAPCAPQLVVSKALDQVTGLATEKHIEVVSRLAPDLPMAEFDVEKITRVLVNLLGNAIRFTPAAGRVSLQVYRDSSVPAYLVFAVSDTGVGIAPSDMQRVLNEGLRVNATPGTGVSTGLGLIFCQRILETHGGRLEAESELGKGSHFRALVPLTRRKA